VFKLIIEQINRCC